MNAVHYAHLLACLQNAIHSKHDFLERLKNEGASQAGRPDFVWHFLLASFATWGSSRGFEGLIRNSANYDRVAWTSIKQMNDSERLVRLQETLRVAKVRMANKKGLLLNRNAELIHALGGVEKASDLARVQIGRDAKIHFLLQFEGIGPKYARNIWMDVYDSDFRQSIAIDERIKAISKFIGVTFRSYDDHEQFYLQLAAELGIDGWDLDRLLYTLKSEILHGST